MSLKRIIKIKIGRFLLNKRAKKIVRTKQFSNFETAKNIAVLFDATSTDNYTTARFLLKYFIDNKIKFKGFGFANPYDAQEQSSAYSGITFFTEDNFSLTGAVINDAVKEFLKTEFDILIDLHQKPNYFIEAINAFSVAKMKLGLKHNDTGFYDFMIDLNKEEANSEVFVEHIKHYLNIIKTK
ncbi:MAG: DUF6913 domain-containing protein [Bacteroidales bacterium]